MGLPERPVVAVLGDGSALYGIQGLWSAAHYGIGVLFIVISNGSYAVMDAQARARGASHPWPGFTGVDLAGLARSLRCPSVRIETYDELTATLAESLAELSERREPLLVEAVVAPDR